MRVDSLQLGETLLLDLRVSTPLSRLPDWFLALFGDPQKVRDKPRTARLTAHPRTEVFVQRAGARAALEVDVHNADGGPVRATATEARDLRLALDHGRVGVTWIAEARFGEDDKHGRNVRPHRLGVQCHVFTPGPLSGDLHVGVDDEVVGRVAVAMRRSRPTMEEVERWLLEEFTLPPGRGRVRRRAVHSGGPADADAAEATAFTLHGRRWVADVGLRDERYRLLRMTEASHRRNAHRPRLSEVDLHFPEATEQKEERERVRAMLASLSESSQSYLGMWDEYNRIEREVLVDEANRIGAAGYESWKITSEGSWRFVLRPSERAAGFLRAIERYDGRLELEAAENLPAELSGGEAQSGLMVRGALLHAWANAWTVDLTPPADADDETAPPPHGWLYRALRGDRVRLDRRQSARDRIWADEAEMRGLGLLLEGVAVGEPQVRESVRYNQVLTRAIRECFAGDPTPSQRRALKMALETPDVLLVQGPPGTGKTQFITALLRCLDQLGDSAIAVNRTLVTSYQHEAVDNVVGKARNKGLPPTRVDSRRGRSQQSARQWREEILARVGEQIDRHHPDAGVRTRMDALRSLVAAYDSQPATAGDLLTILEQAAELAGDLMPPGLRARLAVTREAIAHRLADRLALDGRQRAVALRAVRSLRTAPVAFADDGPDRAGAALPVLAGVAVLDERDTALLERAARWPRGEPPFLDELRELRLSLLTRLTADHRGDVAPTTDPDAQVLLHEIVEACENALDRDPDHVEVVLRAYQSDLHSDLDDVQGTLRRYNGVLASTVQQADSQEMSRILDAPHPVFGTVVVDEAARANPLDLMIPMACAKDRIVLVGDHRQLPHVLELKLERELRKGGRVPADSELTKSLFERWYDMFDEPRSLRTIRLDEQFRMHPTLGRFVSRVFYGSENAVKPHPSTHGLVHDLAGYEGMVAAWIDVPNHRGDEEKDGHSYRRPVEAERLVRELAALADLDADRRLTFGVIAFYRAQRDELINQLVLADLAVPEDDPDKFTPAQKMAWTREPRPRPRLLVGTVDAFQGMEFDVVLLSVTRSSVPRDRSGADVHRYGHLLSDSRMCVAMSRQRRLLIAVGDKAMADRAEAPAESGPDGATGRSLAEGLVAFRELCEGPHGDVRP